MKQETTSKSIAGMGIVAAIAASLCCIAPLLALLAGVSGAAASFSWLEPARSYLIVLAVAALAFAWYKKLSSRQTPACGPDGTCIVQKQSFFNTKKFLVLVTVMAGVLMAFPYYAHVFYPRPARQQVTVVEPNQLQSALFSIKGMTCQGCEAGVNSELFKVAGVTDVHTSYSEGSSLVRFDKTKTSVKALKEAISQTGYQVTDVELLK
jgi:mercuric ion transport protein